MLTKPNWQNFLSFEPVYIYVCYVCMYAIVIFEKKFYSTQQTAGTVRLLVFDIFHSLRTLFEPVRFKTLGLQKTAVLYEGKTLKLPNKLLKLRFRKIAFFCLPRSQSQQIRQHAIAFAIETNE